MCHLSGGTLYLYILLYFLIKITDILGIQHNDVTYIYMVK